MSRSQRFFQLPGVSFVAMAMPGGLIHGIEIDNSSGSWLLIPTLETFIPPYRVGWSMDVPYGATSIDIIAGLPGPAGQISTIQGSGVTVFLSGEGVGSSEGSPDPSAASYGANTGAAASPDAGVPFIQQFTPVIGAQVGTSSNPASTGVGQLLLAAIPGKRFRFYTWGIARSLPEFGDAANGGENGGGLRAVLFNDTDQEDRIFLYNAEMERTHIYPGGLDFPVGNAVTVFYKPAWNDQPCISMFTYSVI